MFILINHFAFRSNWYLICSFLSYSLNSLGVIYGMVTIGLAYLVDVLGETAFMISFNMFGMVGAPVLGLIVNGIFLPFVNSWVSRAKLSFRFSGQ